MGAIKTAFQRLAFVWGGGYHGGSNRSENIWYFGVGGKIWASGGNDTVGGALGYVNIDKSWGRLNVYGAFGYMGINKWGDGSINVGAAVGYANINHSGWTGDINVWGATGGAKIRRSGGWGNVNFSGATGYADIRNYVKNRGHVTFSGAAGGVYLERWGGDRGDVNFWGAAGYAKLVNTANYGDINIGGAAGGFNAWRGGYSGNINVWGAAVANVIKHTASYGDVNYYGAGGANVIYLSGRRGDVNFYGAGAANVITHVADEGYVNFYGAGAANVITRSVQTRGGVRFYGAGAANVITLYGRGEGYINFYGYGNANVLTHTANGGDVNFYGYGDANVITKTGYSGNVNFYGAGIGNVITHTGAYGDVNFYGAGGANVITRVGRRGNVRFYGAGVGNVVTMVADGDLDVRAAGAANIITRKGNGRTYAWLGALGNVVTNVGHGDFELYMIGGANITTKIGNGFNRIVALGEANIHTTVGHGDAEFYMAGKANIVTKVGDGKVSAVLVGLGANILTVTGNGDLEGVFLSAANVVTKVGDGDAAIAMAAVGNIYTQVGRGDTTILAVGQGNIITKVGDGDSYVLAVAVQMTNVPLAANVVTHVGAGNVMGVMFAAASKAAGNVFTKVGDGDVAMALVSVTPDSLNSFTNSGSKPLTANVATQVGNGRTYALMFGGLNVFTKVGSGDYADGWDKWDDSKSDDMLNGGGEKSVADHVNGGMRSAAKGMSPLLANRKFNTIMGAFGSANVMVEVNHESALKQFDNTEAVADIIGKKTTNTIMAGIGGYGNAMVKVGDGDFYGLAVANPTEIGDYFKGALPADSFIGPMTQAQAGLGGSKMNGNIIVHVGHGDTNALAIGSTNIMVKVGDGGAKAIALGDNNIIVRIGDAAGTKQSVNIAGYQAFEGAQLVYGDRNIVVNHGKSNDVIVALDPNMLTNGKKWKEILSSVNPFPAGDETDEYGLKKYEKNPDGSYKTGDDGKPVVSQASKMPWTAPKTGFGFGGLQTAFLEYKKATDSKIKDALDKQEKIDAQFADKKGLKDELPDPYGNFIYGGEGSDIILAIGTNNIVFADSWTSVLDFNLETMYDAGGTNATLSKIPVIGELIGSRTMSLSKLPGIGKYLAPFETALGGLGVEGGFKLLPRSDLGSQIGYTGKSDGSVEATEGFNGADTWTENARGAANFSFTTPSLLTSLGGIFKNIGSLAKGETLSVGSGGEFIKGWNEVKLEFISIVGIPELISSIKTEDPVTGQNVFEQFFDGGSGVGWGGLWKDPAAYWKSIDVLQDNGDIVAAIGMNNVVFTGEGGDLAFNLGKFNIVTLGAGNDMSLTLGADNRVAGGTGNDTLFSIGKSNLAIGGDGNDMIVALGEKNRLTGDNGDDFITVVGNSNTVIGGAGRDFIIAIGSDNSIIGGGDDDLIIALGYQNTYTLGGGNDTVINFGFASTSYYGDGNDVAKANGKDDWLYGERGEDVFYMSGSGNTADGGRDADTFYLGGSDNTAKGGDDGDTFVVTAEIETVSVEDQGSGDRIVIDGSVDIDDIWLSRNGSDLLLEIDRWDQAGGDAAPDVTVGKVRFKDWFSTASNQSKLYFDQDGSTASEVSAVGVNALVDAMASFTRADASGDFRDNMDAAAKNKVASLWGAASKSDSFSVAS